MRASGSSGANGHGATKSGGTLRVAAPTIPLWPDFDLDPRETWNGVAWELFRCCLLRTLYSYNGKPTDEGGMEPRPDLATGMPDVSSDGLTWTFHIRQGLRYAPPFSDTPVVAGDIVRAIERMKGDNPLYYSVIQGFDAFRSGSAKSISGLQVPDDHTLVVTLDQAVGDVAYRFSLAATAPIPEAADGENLGGLLAATGPYMIEGSGDLDPTSPAPERGTPAGFVSPDLGDHPGVLRSAGSITLVRNPSWDPANDGLRPAYPDRIEIELGGEDMELARRIDAGELDVTLGASSPPEQVARYNADPNISGRVEHGTRDAEWFVPMNLAVPPFDDLHVRRAVNLAIDKSELVAIASRPPWGPTGVTSGEVATHIAPDGLEGDLLRDEPDPYPNNLARAEDEMRQSAYDRNGDGRCDAPACRRVLALVYPPPGSGPGLGRAIRSDLARIGIDLDLEVADDFWGRTGDPTERIPISVGWGWGKTFPNASDWFSLLFTSEGLGLSRKSPGLNPTMLGASPAQLHGWGYQVTSVPSVDDNVQKCDALRGQLQTACWAQLDRKLSHVIVPWVPFFAIGRSQVVSGRVASFSFDQFDTEPALDRIALVPGSD